MVKIASVIEDLWIDRVSFSEAYEKAFSKKLSDKTYVLSEKNIEIVKQHLTWNSSKQDKPKNKTSSKTKPKETPKVLKWSELLGWGWFFSWLWFAKKEPQSTKIEKEEQKPEKDLAKPKIEEKKDDFFSQATDIAKQRWTFNAKVIRREQPSSFKSDKPKKSKKNKWNISIWKWVYRDKNKNLRESNEIKASSKKKKEASTSKTLRKKTEITIGKTITVKELTEKMWVPMWDFMKVMLQNKILWWINTVIDYETAVLLAIEFNVEVKAKEETINVEKILEWDLQAILDLDKESDNLQERAPIVTIMWHVDHWKTSLLDYLRKTNIASWEAWGITQSIWASMIKHKDKNITFIDTPWHQLFTSLRARWAKLTNIVVIVVAAEDWLKPQTVESINHAKASWVPIIIWVTKIDKIQDKQKRQVIIDNVKTEIWNYWLIPEDWGWDVSVIWISSKTWEWVEDLLEQITLQAEMLELKYNPDRKAVWVILDAKKDDRQWITASMIILTWTLKIWDIVVVHNTYGKIKRMLNFEKKPVRKVSWWEPVMISWLNDIPEPWRIAEVVSKTKDAQNKIALIENTNSEEEQKTTVQKFLEQKKEEETAILKIILKSDWPSSLEALKQAVSQIPCPENIEIKIIHTWIWIVTDSDIALAQASDAVVIWFNTSIPSLIQKKADQQKLTVKNYNIIYELVEYIEDVLEWMIVVELQEVFIWKLNVLWIFYKKEKTMVIWGKVIEWEIRNKSKFKIIRWDEEIWRWDITSLQKEQESISKISVWHECWMKVKTSKKIEEWDILEIFVME